jgi:hypothetical protein
VRPNQGEQRQHHGVKPRTAGGLGGTSNHSSGGVGQKAKDAYPADAPSGAVFDREPIRNAPSQIQPGYRLAATHASRDQGEGHPSKGLVHAPRPQASKHRSITDSRDKGAAGHKTKAMQDHYDHELTIVEPATPR